MKTLELKDTVNSFVKSYFSGTVRDGLPDDVTSDIESSCEREGIDSASFIESLTNLLYVISLCTSNIGAIRRLASACQVTDDTLFEAVSIEGARRLSHAEAELAEARARAALLPIFLESAKHPFITAEGKDHIKIRNGAIYYEDDELEGVLTIPDMFGGEIVRSIGAVRCEKVTSVVIPPTVTAIFPEAFKDCEALMNIVLPDTIISIGAKAFKGCKLLKAAVLPPGIGVIESETFVDCSSLKTVILPKDLTTIGPFAFYNCSSLETIRFHEKLERIGQGAFASCQLLDEVDLSSCELITHIEKGCFEKCTFLEDVRLPSSIETIDACAFRNCSFLKAVDLPEGLISIGNAAFENCENWKGELEIPESVLHLGQSCFSGCTGLNKVTVPSCPEIPSETFNECHNIHEAILKKAIEIGFWAFSECNALETITVPAHIQHINEYAFEGSGNLASVLLMKTKRDIPKGTFPEGLDWEEPHVNP